MKLISLFLLLALALTACAPAATSTEPRIPVTETSSASPRVSISTSTVTPSIATTIYPTITPAPTLTAIPTLKVGQPIILANIHMNDEQNGWGIDASEHIIHTIDGGNTWNDVTPASGAYRDSGFFALDANTAWATPHQSGCYTENCTPAPNNASVWHTTDAGKTWQEQHICLLDQDCGFYFDVAPSYYLPIALHFVDAQTGWLLITVEHVMFQDRYVLYQTSDGGRLWSPILDNINGPFVMSVTGIAFQDKQTGWFTTSQIGGATDPVADWSIYQSTDAGHKWHQIQLPEPHPFLEEFTPNTVWCGAQNVQVIPPTTIGVMIHCIHLENIPRPAEDFYFHSIDGGKHWVSWLAAVHRTDSDKNAGTLIAGGNVMFTNPLVGWRTSFNLGTATWDVEKTQDGGQTWQYVKTVQWNGDLDFVSEEVGWAIATYGNVATLVHTTDGGHTWQEIKPVVGTSTSQ